jgi:hypothetical protein
MKIRSLTTTVITALVASFALGADETNPIKEAMRFAHKAPKGEKKKCELIIEGTISEADLTKTLELYKAACATKPPKGDEAAYKARFSKLVAATADVIAKKEGATAAYKEAVNCKACHSEHKPD